MITAYPHPYVVGAISEQSNVLLCKDEELTTVTLEEVTAEYMYSNPQGIFNLTTPDKLWRNPQNYTQVGYTSWQLA